LSVPTVSVPSFSRFRSATAQPGIAAWDYGPPVAVAASPRARTVRARTKETARIADPLLVTFDWGGASVSASCARPGSAERIPAAQKTLKAAALAAA
jgi:hypothetical protein